MFLRSLEVKKFRGIVSGRLDLDETTVLIGENDCGKSSLLAAIAVALAGPPEAPPHIECHHFHRPADPAQPPQGPVRIELEFAERSAGEWDGEAAKPLAPLLASAPTGNRVLRLVVEAELPEDDGPPQVHWRVASPGRNVADSSSDRIGVTPMPAPTI